MLRLTAPVIAFDVRRTGERNPNLKLGGLPVLYIPRYFEFFVRAIWTPLLVFEGPVPFFKSGRPHGRILVGLVFMAVLGCCTWLVADIVTGTILSCLFYNLNGQKLSSNTLIFQHNHQMFSGSSLALQDFEAETQADLEVKGYQNIILCGVRF